MTDYKVYKIHSSTTTLVYIGYCEGDVIKTFLSNARTPDETRGDVRWYEAHGSEEEGIEYTTLDGCGCEQDAKDSRNLERSLDHYSITGPTNWPDSDKRAKKNNPALFAVIEQNKLIRNHNIAIRAAESAKDAANLGAFDRKTAMNLAKTHDRQQVLSHWTGLNAVDFSEKYGIPITYAKTI